MTKQDLMDNFDDVVTDRSLKQTDIFGFLEDSKDPRELFNGQYVVLQSSGSSGKPGVVVYTPEEMANASVQSLRVTPSSLKRRMVYFGAADGHYAGAALSVSA